MSTRLILNKKELAHVLKATAAAQSALDSAYVEFQWKRFKRGEPGVSSHVTFVRRFNGQISVWWCNNRTFSPSYRERKEEYTSVEIMILAYSGSDNKVLKGD